MTGVERQSLDAHVVAITFERSGAHAGFALGDGTIRIAGSEGPGPWTTIEAHDGAILALAQDTAPTGFLSGGDDGRLVRTAADAHGYAASELARFGAKWLEQVASFTNGKDAVIACSAGKIAHILTASGETLKSLTHPSTVTGLALDAKGKRIAASHYNGASVWYVNAKAGTPRLLEWKGSHTGIAMHPEGDAVVTCMQENALHGWRLADGEHMRMTGYPTKTESIAFSRNGRWLASSGADAIVLWPFFGGGPMGKPPLEIGQQSNTVCTRVACHPLGDIVAAGYADGSIVLAELTTRTANVVQQGEGSPITALAWHPGGRMFALGAENGMAAIIRI